MIMYYQLKKGGCRGYALVERSQVPDETTYTGAMVVAGPGSALRAGKGVAVHYTNPC